VSVSSSHRGKADTLGQTVAQGSVTRQSFATLRFAARKKIPKCIQAFLTSHVRKLKEIKGTLETMK